MAVDREHIGSPPFGPDLPTGLPPLVHSMPRPGRGATLAQGAGRGRLLWGNRRMLFRARVASPSQHTRPAVTCPSRIAGSGEGSSGAGGLFGGEAVSSAVAAAAVPLPRAPETASPGSLIAACGGVRRYAPLGGASTRVAATHRTMAGPVWCDGQRHRGHFSRGSCRGGRTGVARQGVTYGADPPTTAQREASRSRDGRVINRAYEGPQHPWTAAWYGRPDPAPTSRGVPRHQRYAGVGRGRAPEQRMTRLSAGPGMGSMVGGSGLEPLTS